MKVRRIISFALAAVMLGSTATVIASAEETEEKTYNYVCLGDSIASGYQLEGAEDLYMDRALILSEDLIANPIQDAYAQVFGNMLAELGAEKGYTTTAVNLASTAYRAEDVEKTILVDGYKGEVATLILENFVAPGTSEALVPYHNIYMKYLPNADMVSIQLGGNDVIMAMVYPMFTTSNIVIKATGISLALVLFGEDLTYAVAAGIKTLYDNKDLITLEALSEATQYFASVLKNKELFVDNAAANVKGVVDTVKSVNPTTDIALINMFNPYGNSLEYDGQVRDLGTVIRNIFAAAVDEAVDINIEVGEVEITPAADAEDGEEIAEQLNEISVEINDITVPDSYFDEMRKERLKALLTIAANEIAYPLQYLLVGKNIDGLLQKLNAELADVADETDSYYVDVYDISNECNLDPHPLAKGHREIAERLYAKIADRIGRKMDGIVVGDINGDGVVTIEDATILQNYLSEMDVDVFIEGAADVNLDGTIDVRDVTEIQRYLADIPVNKEIAK